METLTVHAISITRMRLPSRAAIVHVVAEVIRIGIASVFLFSGLSKLRAPYDFVAAIYGYQLTGPLLSLVIATVFPWLEVLVAICLWANVLRRGAMMVTIILATIFSVVLGCALYRQLDISCGCFSAADKISYLTLIRSLSLLAAGVVGLVLNISASQRSESQSASG